MMNDHTRLRHPVATRATRIAAGSLLALAAIGAATGATVAAPGGNGAIWTTNAPCTEPAPQNRNQYAAGETVYVRGENFDATAAVGWTITGQPGGASGDPRAIVSSGSATTDADGGFCLAAYVVAADDWGEYTVDVTQDRAKKNDNYTVSGTDPGTTDPGTTDPGTTDSGTTDPGTTDPGTTDPGTTGGSNGGTTDPGPTGGSNGGTTDPGPTDPGPTDPGTTGGSNGGTTDPGPTGGSNGGTTDSTNRATTGSTTTDGSTGDTSTGDTTPTQSVLGEVGFGPGFELPATDTVTDLVASGSSILLMLALAGLAGLAVLLAPNRRRAPDATA